MISERNLTKPAHRTVHSGARPRHPGQPVAFKTTRAFWVYCFFLHSIPLPLRQSPPPGLLPLLHQQISV